MDREVIDIHVHFGAPKDPESGCFWSEEFTETAAYYAMLLLTKSLFKKVNIQSIKKHILGVINGSKFVNKCVLLAMDQVYDESGNPRQEKTHLYVPNSYVANLAKDNERILFGASVHPFRNDWSEELDRCLENKAVVCKWIPSSQMINPAHNNHLPFYKKLADHNLPLLCHAGPEYAIPTSFKFYNAFNNPEYLKMPLDQGVSLVIAHCSMPYFGLLDNPTYESSFLNFIKLANEADVKGWNLYADLSAICIPSREEYVRKALDNIPPKRLVYGSDYPVPLTEFCYNKGKSFWGRLAFIIKIALMENPLDKNYHLIKEMGFEEEVFTKASELFSKLVY